MAQFLEDIVSSKQTIAVFDFDKTMSDRHSFWRFIRYCVGPIAFYTAIFYLIKQIYNYYTQKITLMELRVVVIAHFFKGMPEVVLKEKSTRFSEQKIPQWIVKEALAKVKSHQGQGHQLILVSNATEDYLIPWAASVGFHLVVGSRFEIKEGVLTGKLLGKNCYGQEKVNRLGQEIGELSQYEVYAYGDSEGDKELLALANYPYYRSYTKQGVYTATS